MTNTYTGAKMTVGIAKWILLLLIIFCAETEASMKKNHASIKAGFLVGDVSYDPIAAVYQIGGTVVVHLTRDSDGILSVHAVKGPRILFSSALNALTSWKAEYSDVKEADVVFIFKIPRRADPCFTTDKKISITGDNEITVEAPVNQICERLGHE